MQFIFNFEILHPLVSQEGIGSQEVRGTPTWWSRQWQWMGDGVEGALPWCWAQHTILGPQSQEWR